MDVLWAPWREAYVIKAGRKKSGDACIFCAILNQKKDSKNYIFIRTSFSFAVLNIYPFNGGHSLVIPNRHVDDLEKMSGEERNDLLDLVVRTKALLTRALKVQAFNVGINFGHVAGAGIPEHLHVHIVPRWTGDVNFMPVLFGTKVMPVSLRNIYKALKNADKS